MNKKLDLNGVRIYSSTEQDVIDAISLIGEEVYMSDYEDFSKNCKTEFIGIKYLTLERDKYPFIGKNESGHCPFRYFVLAKDVKFVEKEKQILRACASIEEFKNVTDIQKFGDVIRIRRKNLDHECNLTYCGYTLNSSCFCVHLGAFAFSIQELFKEWDCYDKELNHWFPIGVLDDE